MNSNCTSEWLRDQNKATVIGAVKEKRAQSIVDSGLAKRGIDLCKTLRIHDNTNEYLNEGRRRIRDGTAEGLALIP